MTVPVWQPATIYLPGAIVQPRSAQTLVVQAQPYNNSFEDGLTNWDITPSGPAGACSQSSEEAFDGTYSALFSGYEGGGTRSSATATLTNSFMAPVKPGQSIAFSCMIQYTVGPNPNGAFANGSCGIAWYDADMAFIFVFRGQQSLIPGRAARRHSWLHESGPEHVAEKLRYRHRAGRSCLRGSRHMA